MMQPASLQATTSAIGVLAPAAPRNPIGIMPNAAHQAPHGLFDMGRYELAIGPRTPGTSASGQLKIVALRPTGKTFF